MLGYNTPPPIGKGRRRGGGGAEDEKNFDLKEKKKDE